MYSSETNFAEIRPEVWERRHSSYASMRAVTIETILLHLNIPPAPEGWLSYEHYNHKIIGLCLARSVYHSDYGHGCNYIYISEAHFKSRIT